MRCIYGIKILLATLMILILAAHVAKSGECDGHLYNAVLVTNGITWEDANTAAKAMGGHLATIMSSKENDCVYSFVANDDHFWLVVGGGSWLGPWLGGYQPHGSSEPGGGWMWVTGEPFAYTNWEDGEPNNYEGNEEDRIHFKGNKLKGSAWNDGSDEAKLMGYIVEFDRVISVTKTASPYSLRQFQESTIKVMIENSGTSEVKAIEIMDSIHPSFDLTGGDFPNPKKFDSIRAGESRELQYTIKSKDSGAFTLDPATVTYADSEGNIQEVKSEPVSIKVVPSSEGSASGASSGQSSGQTSKSASVSLTGEKTDVVLGEDILLKLSAVNLITKPKMHVQVIIIPPSGMSVTSTEFSKSGTNQFTANYELEPGDGKDIEVKIKPNQIGEFNVNGRIIYYFGDEKEKAEDHTLPLPIKVRKEAAPQQDQTQAPNSNPSTAGFEAIISICGILLVSFLRKK